LFSFCFPLSSFFFFLFFPTVSGGKSFLRTEKNNTPIIADVHFSQFWPTEKLDKNCNKKLFFELYFERCVFSIFVVIESRLFTKSLALTVGEFRETKK